MTEISANTDKVVRGALLAAIHDHGPITSELVPSAVKRVVNQIRAAAEADFPIFGAGEDHIDCRAAYETAITRYRRLQHGHQRLLEQYVELQARESTP